MKQLATKVSIEDLLDHANWLQALARQLCLDNARADDAVQQTWLDALKAPPRIQGNLRGWLARVLRRNVMRSRDHDVLALTQSNQLSAESASTHDVVERFHIRQILAEQVLKLPPADRQVILLQYFEGQPPRKIAHELGIPVETVRTRVKRARERLRREFERHYPQDEFRCHLALLGLSAAYGAPSLATRLILTCQAFIGAFFVPTLAKFSALAVTAIVIAGIYWATSEDSVGIDLTQDVEVQDMARDLSEVRRADVKPPAKPGRVPTARMPNDVAVETSPPTSTRVSRFYGQVRTETGKLVPGATVYMVEEGKTHHFNGVQEFSVYVCSVLLRESQARMASPVARPNLQHRSTRTDAEGKFEFPDLLSHEQSEENKPPSLPIRF